MKKLLFNITSLLLIIPFGYSFLNEITMFNIDVSRNYMFLLGIIAVLILYFIFSSPVVAIVKKYDRVVKHAYISAGSSYTFEVTDGTYQVFFYYGTSWNKNKKMKSSECASLYGGWDKNENFDKDDGTITLKGQSMTYTLTSVTNGNFQTKDSSIEEAL
jgi:hypothetical protein